LFFDWDLDAETYSTNVIDFDAARNLGYTYDTGSGPDTYAGITLLTDQNISYRAIYNDDGASGNPSWGIYDGFTDAEKWEAISGGVVYSQAGPEDVSQVIAAGPISIAPGEKNVVAFAMLAGDNLLDLQNNSDASNMFWQQLEPLDVESEKKNRVVKNFELGQNYPNPFNPLTKIEFKIPSAQYVRLEIYNSTGQKVADLIDQNLGSGRYEVSWDARNFASGVYFYQLRAGSFVQRRKMLLVK
jgi:hypothetical protein